MEFNNAQQEERIRYKDQILSVTQSLEDLKKAIDASSRQLKDVVKPVARKYTEVASITIPKVNTHIKQCLLNHILFLFDVDESSLL